MGPDCLLHGRFYVRNSFILLRSCLYFIKQYSNNGHSSQGYIAVQVTDH